MADGGQAAQGAPFVHPGWPLQPAAASARRAGHARAQVPGGDGGDGHGAGGGSHVLPARRARGRRVQVEGQAVQERALLRRPDLRVDRGDR